jgi:antitoxin component YwqK of YwqJK toxin-antitoxin module
MTNYSSTVLNEQGQLVGAVEPTGASGVEVIRHWSQSGVLTLEAETVAGEYHGRYCSWWDNGAVKEEGSFNHGKRTGIYRWYKDTGVLWQEQDFGNIL